MSEPVSPTENEPPPDEAPEPRRREPVFNLPPVVLAAIGICAAVFLLQQYVLDDAQNMVLLYD
ncbi:MAG: rhomboid family intramembrane serine protease, partial [Mesorhizobium sp.]